MKAVIHERFGLDAVDFRDVPVPTIGDDQVLVRVRASSVNPIEWYEVYAPPFVRVLGGSAPSSKGLASRHGLRGSRRVHREGRHGHRAGRRGLRHRCGVVGRVRDRERRPGSRQSPRPSRSRMPRRLRSPR